MKVRELLPFIFIILSLSGCSLCRYQAMKNAAWAYEEGHDVEYVMYSTSPIFSMGMFNAHVQATFKENGNGFPTSSELYLLILIIQWVNTVG